jgi:hypothetical protein
VTHLSCNSNAGGWDNRPACCPGCAFMGLPAMRHRAPGCSQGWSAQRHHQKVAENVSPALQVHMMFETHQSNCIYYVVKHVLQTMSSIFKDIRTSSDLQT